MVNRLNEKTQERLKDFVQDLQRRGYTKYKVTMEVSTEFDLYYERAYYYMRKFWVK